MGNIALLHKCLYLTKTKRDPFPLGQDHPSLHPAHPLGLGRVGLTLFSPNGIGCGILVPD
jgi:hypothetical protein